MSKKDKKNLDLLLSQNDLHNKHQDDGRLERPKRQRKKNKSERGLAPLDELMELAREYLKFQHGAWPDLVKAGVLPPVSDSVLGEMVNDLKKRHAGELPDHSRCARPVLARCSFIQRSCTPPQDSNSPIDAGPAPSAAQLLTQETAMGMSSRC